MELTRFLPGISHFLLMLIVYSSGQMYQPFPPQPATRGLSSSPFTPFTNPNTQPRDFTSQGSPPFQEAFVPNIFDPQSKVPARPFGFPPNSPFSSLFNPPSPGSIFPADRSSSIPNPPSPGSISPVDRSSSFPNPPSPGFSPDKGSSNLPSPQSPGSSPNGGISSSPDLQNPDSTSDDKSFSNPQSPGSSSNDGSSSVANPQSPTSNSPADGSSGIPNPQSPSPNSPVVKSPGFPNPSNSDSSSDPGGSISDLQAPSSNPPDSSAPGSDASSHAIPETGLASHSQDPGSSLPKDPLGGKKIVCLFNNKHFYRDGFTPALIDPSLCTHVNYEFAILDPKTYEMITGEPDLDIELNFYDEVIGLKKLNEKLKVMLSLGGWEDSTKKYSDMANDASKRKNFIEKVISFLINHEFDGLDLAWEYPNCWQGALNISPKDKKNFVLLLKEMKPEFEKNGLILSISVAAIKREIEAAYDVPEVAASVDFINVMTYDMHGPWESVTGHHTQFEGKPDDSDPYCNVKSAMQLWVDSGAPKEKLNLGLALYGKTFTLENADKFDMGAPAVGMGNPGPLTKTGGTLAYSEICQFLDSGNWTEGEDKKAGYYAHGGDQWACYDPPMMMVKKAKFIVDHEYGGVLLKDLSSEDYKGVCFSMPFPLLRMLKLEIIQKIKRLHRKQRQ